MKRALSAMLAVLLFLLPCMGISASAAEVSPAVQSDPGKANKQSTAYVCFYPGDEEVIQPISLKYEGLLRLTLTAASETAAFGYLECDLYADEACTIPCGASLDLIPGSTAQRSIYADAGTVYLKCRLTRVTDTRLRYRFILKSSLIPGNDRTLTEGEAVLTGFDAAHTVCRYKVTVPKTGYLTMRVCGTDGRRVNAYFTLLNASKKAISAESHVICEQDESGGYYAEKLYVVKKGVYYIELDMKGAYAEGYEVSYAVKGASDQSGSSKKKAVSLSVSGKAKTGMLTASEKAGSVDWYKVTLTKKTQLKVLVDAIGDGDVLLQVTDSTGADAWYGSRMIASGATEFDAGKLPKGVYYIKVVKPESKCSMAYSIRVKS